MLNILHLWGKNKSTVNYSLLLILDKWINWWMIIYGCRTMFLNTPLWLICNIIIMDCSQKYHNLFINIIIGPTFGYQSWLSNLAFWRTSGDVLDYYIVYDKCVALSPPHGWGTQYIDSTLAFWYKLDSTGCACLQLHTSTVWVLLRHRRFRSMSTNPISLLYS